MKQDNQLTVYIGIRPFKNRWKKLNFSVLNAIKWQGIDDLKVKLVCWADEQSTMTFAQKNGYESLLIPWYTQYLFDGYQKSFMTMMETILLDCETELLVYINGDIVLGPGIFQWLVKNAASRTLYSLPRHGWHPKGVLNNQEAFYFALQEAVPEEWTAVDLFAFSAQDGRNDFSSMPPFLLTAGSMDSWLLLRASELGWRRVMLPPDQYHMLHIEHPYSHPLKPGASADRLPRWAFNAGVYAQALEEMNITGDTDTSMSFFDNAQRHVFKYGLPVNTYQTISDLQAESPSTKYENDGRGECEAEGEGEGEG